MSLESYFLRSFKDSAGLKTICIEGHGNNIKVINVNPLEMESLKTTVEEHRNLINICLFHVWLKPFKG